MLDYINNDNAVHFAWPAVFNKLISLPRSRSLKAGSKPTLKVSGSKAQAKNIKEKVLLIGIDDYPNPEDKLYGCLNDVFRMSEVLQEAGIAPENIKVVLNERATAENVRSSMNWLLKDAKKGDFRFFYYSGHGAQIPSDGMEGEEDSHDECLVTYDFDWTRTNAYTDKEFLRAYSQLPYEVDFVSVLDCCHSGGLARDGIFRARGITPPDDIRHRTIKWDPKRQMWISRDSDLGKRKIFKPSVKVDERKQFIGKNNNVYRFGRAVHLWGEYNKFEKAKKKYGTKGPYMPLIIESCRRSVCLRIQTWSRFIWSIYLLFIYNPQDLRKKTIKKVQL
ncbi:MAG: caspase family protein [Bacteroidetes bacterium]|nr:caspase family protein [Bacteroidota bacterium]